MRKTDGLEDKLTALLNDPQSMAQLLSMAQSLGLSPPEATPAGEPPPAPPPVPPPVPPMDEGMLRSVMQLMQEAQHTDARQEALLCALKPFLRPERRAALDRASELARISRLAGAALKGGALGGGKGGF